LSEMRRILLSAYACEPFRGSEPGVGWNWVRQASRFGQIWVITRSNNRKNIDKALSREPFSNVQFVYVDLPKWARVWKRGDRGIHLYYYLWQIRAYFIARRLHRTIGFDLVHHVTFVNFWMPSFVSLLSARFVWGPVGGGESAPLAFWRSLGWRGVAYETVRWLARTLGTLDPFVRLTASRAARAFATTQETATMLGRLGCRNVALLSEAALPNEEIERFAKVPDAPERPFRVLSLGRLLHWKGFHLGIQAFARFVKVFPDSEYWILGAGPDEKRLERLVGDLKLTGKVFLAGRVPREEAVAQLTKCHILLHPSLHDSGGWVCLEAMAAGRPVICLGLGGPGVQVSEETGVKVSGTTPGRVVADISAAMVRLAEDPALRRSMGAAGRRRVAEHFNWELKGRSALGSLAFSEDVGVQP
jgi:glycosyltransferase involved in cell wall biosynthesis